MQLFEVQGRSIKNGEDWKWQEKIANEKVFFKQFKLVWISFFFLLRKSKYTSERIECKRNRQK